MFKSSNNQFFVKKKKIPLTKELEPLIYSSTRKANEKVYAILQRVDPSDVTDASGTTLLHLAADSCNLNMARYLIKRGCVIDAKDNLGRTPIMIALHKGYIDNIELLLDANADVYAADSTGQSALTMVLHKPDQLYPHLVRLFLKKVIVRCKNNEEIVKILCDIGCPLDCVVCLKNAEVTKMMLDRGYFPEIDAKRNDDNTALHVAVFMTDAGNVKTLLEHNAGVNTRNVDGEMPLMLNFFNRNDDEDLKVLATLLSYGADLTALDNTGKMQVYQLLTKGKREAVRMVLQHGLDLNARDGLQSTALFYLIKNHKPWVIEELKNRRVDWNSRNASGFTVLHIAMSQGDPKLVRFLISMGADVNAMDEEGRTPMFHAFTPAKIKHHRQCVEILLEHGADAQVVSNHFNTVIDIASIFYNFDTVEPILGHLALLEDLGNPIVERIRRQIQSNSRFQECYYLRQQQLEKMKKDVVYGTVTMYKILTEPEETIAQYARNQKTVERVMEYANDSYYYEIVYRRFTRARDLAELRNQAAIVLNNEIFAMDDIVMDKIISFLTYQDLQKFRNANI